MVSFRRGLSCSLFLAFALIFGSATSANAQQIFGRIFGTVTDASGGAVPNAKVTITDQSKNTQFDATTNESGNYERGQLIPDPYTVQVEAPGFARQQFKDIAVQVDNAARVDATLSPGNVSETVEVTTAAPTLQSDRADVQTTFTAKELVDLPLLTRNAQALELLAPGTSRASFAHASSEDPQGSAQIEVNGQHFSGTGFQLDGTENQDPILGLIVINPNIDSLAEQKISSQDYDAEFGYAGAGIQNASTKSGTNQFHFTAFEYLRNSSPGFADFGRDPFSEPNGAPLLKYNQFGGSFGGALIKNKLFYFGDAELLRQRFGGSVLTTVPTAAARNGDLSGYLGTPLAGAPSVQDTAGNSVQLRPNMIFDPTTGDPITGVGRQAFAGNVIPRSRLNQPALNLLQYFPLPNAPGTPGASYQNNYAASGGATFDANKWDTRADYFMNEQTTFFGRYSNHQFARGAVGAFGSLAGGPAFNGVNFAGNSFSRDQSLALGTTHTFNPTLVNEFRLGYMKYFVATSPNGLGTSPATAAGIPNANLDNFYTSGLPYFAFRNGPNDGDSTSLGYSLGANQCNCPLTEDEGQYQFTDNISKTAGNHTFKFGADIRYAKNLRVPSDAHRAGEFVFSNDQTSYISAQGSGGQAGQYFGSYLLGDVATFRRYVSTNTNASEHQRRWFFYGQDSYRVTPKLTVNYGLRWELVFPEKVNGPLSGAQLDLSTGLINVFGAGNVSQQGVQNMNYLNFAPRLGIAYQLNSKTVIRTGYGWSYELGTFGATFGHNVTQNPPVLSNQQVVPGNTFQTVFTLDQGPPTLAPIVVNPATGQFLLPNGINGKARPQDVRLPRVEAYNFTIERQLFSNTSLSVGYVGNTGRHVGRGSGDGFNSNPNAPAFIPGIPVQNLAKPFFLKYGWTQGIDFYCQCANNQYNSLQAQLKRTFSGGYGVQLSYTWQDAQGDAADDYTFFYNRPLGYGRETSIPDHELVISQTYSVPFGRGRKYGANINRAVDAVAGGWNISGITTFYSGLPFTPGVGDFNSAAAASTGSGATGSGGTGAGSTTTRIIRPYVGPSGRPDKGTCSPYAGNQSRAGWLNLAPCAFAVPANNTFGNFGYNTLRGPIFINQDVVLSKSFRITERLSWQLRGEAYNIFNHANLGLPNGNFNGPGAGTINGLAFGSTMRRLQFASRLDF